MSWVDVWGEVCTERGRERERGEGKRVGDGAIRITFKVPPKMLKYTCFKCINYWNNSVSQIK